MPLKRVIAVSVTVLLALALADLANTQRRARPTTVAVADAIRVFPNRASRAEAIEPLQPTTTTTNSTTTTTAAPTTTTTARAVRTVRAPTPPAPAAGWSRAQASWYGPGFYGSGTACGQRYSASIVGVAHKTLPCGTMVTFEHDGIVVTAPVIDRGPYVGGRMWDLSYALCQQLRHCFTDAISYRY